MIGMTIGLVVGACVSIFTDASWWWLFAWGIGGGFMELATRLGAGEEVADAIGSCVDAAASIDFSSGD